MLGMHLLSASNFHFSSCYPWTGAPTFLFFFLKNKRSFLLFGNQSVFLRALAYHVRYTAGTDLLPTHSQTSSQGNTHPLIWVQSKINNRCHIVLGSPTIHLPLSFETNTSREALGSQHPSAMCVLSSVR